MNLSGRKRRLLVVLFCAFFLGTAASLSVERRKLPGIWKLKTNSLPYEQDIKSKLKGLLPGETPEEVLIKLNEDGSFKQCNEGYQEGRWMAGRWKLNNENRLILAMRRQYYGPRFDVILNGSSIQVNATLRVTGEVQKGKFMYPQRHPSFFETPIANPDALGSFTLEQTLSTSSIVPTIRVQDSDEATEFEMSDFWNRRFYLTVEPLDSDKPVAATGESFDVPIDLRAMPIRFFQNNTFAAEAVNKILRGRFTTEAPNKLTFIVSLFGSGRSAPGSVFSEGIGLSHEDKRSYVGEIRERDGRLYVDGTAFFGDDMGSDARPEPVGTFRLLQIENESITGSYGKEDSSRKDVFE